MIGRVLEDADIGVEGTVGADEGGGGVTARSNFTVVLVMVSPPACEMVVVDSAVIVKVTFPSSSIFISSASGLGLISASASNLARFLDGEVTMTSCEDSESSPSSA